MPRSGAGLTTGIIMVPGCEPTSTITSTVLDANLRTVCNGSFVEVADALAAIPGSYVERLDNFANGVGGRLFVFPPVDQFCPIPGYNGVCMQITDYYKILKSLNTTTPPSDCLDGCESIDYKCCKDGGFGFDQGGNL